MTISYVLAPIPKWYFADNTGKPLGNGFMKVKSSLNPSLDKQVFQDPFGAAPYPNPVPFALNGTAGPFYWQIDSTQPEDLYFLDVYDSSGNPVFNITNYPISGGGGGGGGGTIALPIKNVIVNNSFINNIGSSSVSPIADGTFLAPSAHSNLAFPDLTYFHTGSLSATDSITFNQFNPPGSNPFSPDYVTAYYMNYTCTNNPAGEISKGYRIPLCPFVNTMAGQTFSIKFRARCTSGANTINIRALQYFGTGGTPSSPVRTLDVPFVLSNVWTEYSLFVTLPVIGGQTLGNSNDDGTYLEISLPINQSTNIDIAKVALYPGTIVPQTDFESFEEIEGRAETPRTGDVRTSMNPFSYTVPPAGWIPLNNGTIGNSLSGATTRANADSWLLFNLIWNNTSNADCPVSGGKGGSSLSDWNANKTIMLPQTTGRVIANRGGNPLGNAFGNNTATLAPPNLPPHQHTTVINANQNIGVAFAVARGNSAGSANLAYASDAGPGTSQPFSIQQPTVNYNMIIKL